MGLLPGQIAVIAFGALAVSAEFHNGFLRVSLAAVPRRGRWFAAKAVAVGVPSLVTGLLTAACSLAAARASMGGAADTLTTGQQTRAVVGGGVYLALMALLAAGLAALLRSGVGALSILVPFVLVVSFVVGDAAGKVTDFLPDKAGQVVLHQTWEGTLGPWTGLAVTAGWAAAALAAGAWRVRRRDA
ncbi:ABC transporter permease [Streptomyces sp. NPDC006458]|uniref:ABC transporter permease n=1 Tax=Streptomyces sp. NPDC006458 TaxID=3154302 RepID=UPI0033B337DA